MSRMYWAKPDQTYDEHITAAYRSWQETIIAKKNLIKRTGKLCGFDPDRFLQSSLLTVVLHDIGKNIVPFQRMMEAKRAGKSFDFGENYRHEIVSCLYTQYAGIALQQKEGNLLSISLPIEALAVLGHHKAINPTMEAFSRELTASPPAICNEGVTQAIDLARDIFAEEGYKLPTFSLSKENKDPMKYVNWLIGTEGKVPVFYEKFKDPDALRSSYALLKGILHYADWHGSAGTHVAYSLQAKENDLLDSIRKRCQEKQIEFTGLRPFQEACASTLGHCIAIAPTGGGKTEGSLLWALRNLADMGGGKLIYLLPTMVTANSIFQRLEDFFGKGNVGLTHSTASLLFADEEDDRATLRSALFDKTFITPATVATVDQLLFAGFNTGKWPVVEANAANSTIIIDEIHAYDPWTLGLLLKAIQHFSSLGARFMLMSATLPAYIRDLLIRTLPAVRVVRDETLLASARNIIQTVNAPLEEAVEGIAIAVENGTKTLVVANSVGACQALSITFREMGLDPLCYHSKFTLQDRADKEEKINAGSDAPDLLVATQVVEVSLDIDYDLMFTECAPPDAIVQRAGRVNRRRKKSDSCIRLYRPSRLSEKIYDPDRTGLLNRAFEAFCNGPTRPTESDLTAIVETVYAGREITDDERFREACSQYARSQRQRSGIFDSPQRDPLYEVTRKIDYPQIPVIPMTFHDIVKVLQPRERRWYEVKMPAWYVKKHRDIQGDVIFCDMEYDPDLGARFTDTPELSFMMI